MSVLSTSSASGSRLKAERERLSLSIRDVSLISRDLAKQRDNPDYYIAHSTLADIENGKQMPSIYKLYSLSVIYRRRYDEVAAWCGVPIADTEKEHRALALPRTYLLGSPPEDEVRVILTASELRQKLGSEPTNLVSRMVDAWKGEMPKALLQYLDWEKNLYGYVGMRDNTLFPHVRPGSFVQIDPRQKRILPLGWHGDHDRPVYFFELRDSYVCSWCELHDSDLILVPSRESGRHARHVRYPKDVTIVGRVTAVSMRIADATAHQPWPAGMNETRR